MKKVDIKLGYSCNNDCIHCVISDNRDMCLGKGFSEDLSTERYIEEMRDSRERGAEVIVFTGGEPSIRSDLVTLITHARQMGYTIMMQTNGRAFHFADFARKVTKTAPVNYCVALHADREELHDAITRKKGSFRETVMGIKNLVNLGAEVSGKIVLSKVNLPRLEHTSEYLVALGVSAVSIVFPHACGNARKLFADVVPSYTSLVPALHRAIASLESYGIPVDVEAVPFCLMTGFERYVQDLTYFLSDETELKQYGLEPIMDWARERKRIKRKFTRCRECRFDLLCEGPWMEYPEHFGDGEFIPVRGEKLRDAAVVLRGAPFFTGPATLLTHHALSW
ncbi:MAG: radical SAM protein [Candidatus Eremiobacteraeota bacterium]|nr:radical SAM protein [Candidatus Eremiobacteraeota bacterium]